MSFISENIDIKIREVGRMNLSVHAVVAPRPYHCLSLRTNGGAEFDFGDKRLATRVGDIFYMPAGVGYKVEYSEQNEIIFVHFESSVDSAPENFSFAANDGISSLFFKLLELWDKKESGSYFYSLSVFAKLLGSIAERSAESPNSKVMAAFNSAIIYMENNFTDPNFSVEALVEHAHMSNTYFRKLFLSKYGKNPVQYILTMRLSLAEKLLSDGRCSVGEVSERCGFFDVKYFSRMMKREYGVPPSKLYKHIKA